jgi:hypothetical protein
MLRGNSRRSFTSVVLFSLALLTVAALAHAQETAPTKAPPERTYSNAPFVHRIVLLDEDGTPIRPTKPGEEASAGAPASNKPVSLAKTCGKCHSDYDVMSHGWHFNASEAGAPQGRPGEPWILTDPQTRTQIPLSYRGWKGTFHPYDVGINDFNFVRLFGRHYPGGGALANSKDLRFKASGGLEIDCLICHTRDNGYDAAARATQILTDQNFKYAPTLAAFLGKVQGSASKLRDNFDPTGPDGRRAPKINYDASRFDDVGQVVFDIVRRVPNERCYFCHTTIDAGRADSKDNAALESRWRHDRDIHLVKGMLCVDCHRNGADHMIVRGYEGEYEDRIRDDEKLADSRAGKADPTITTLSCQGCHYGTNTMPGGRNAAPRPVHHGMPTLHFDELSCTACHSGPKRTDAAALVQTSMAHKLGLPRHETVDAAAPVIAQPVFQRDPRTHKLTPNRVLFPSYWGWMSDDKITPILPEQVMAAGVGDIVGAKPDAKAFPAPSPALTKDQINQVLEKLAAAPRVAVKPADAVTARGATTNPASAPSTAPAGEPVFVYGETLYKRSGVTPLPASTAGPYAWPLAHDVRPAQQALGARGCTECHTNGAPIFHMTIAAAPGVSIDRSRGSSAMQVFNATYPLRWLVIIVGYISATIVLLAWLKQKLATTGTKQ